MSLTSTFGRRGNKAANNRQRGNRQIGIGMYYSLFIYILLHKGATQVKPHSSNTVGYKIIVSYFFTNRVVSKK